MLLFRYEKTKKAPHRQGTMEAVVPPLFARRSMSSVDRSRLAVASIENGSLRVPISGNIRGEWDGQAVAAVFRLPAPGSIPQKAAHRFAATTGSLKRVTLRTCSVHRQVIHHYTPLACVVNTTVRLDFYLSCTRAISINRADSSVSVIRVHDSKSTPVTESGTFILRRLRVGLVF